MLDSKVYLGTVCMRLVTNLVHLEIIHKYVNKMIGTEFRKHKIMVDK